MTKALVSIKHHTGIVLDVTAPAPGIGLASIRVSLDAALKVDLPLDEFELRALRDGTDKALALIVKSK